MALLCCREQKRFCSVINPIFFKYKRAFDIYQIVNFLFLSIIAYVISKIRLAGSRVNGSLDEILLPGYVDGAHCVQGLNMGEV